MNSNLFAVALTTLALGALAASDIIPGLGFYPGIVMLSIGGLLLVGPFIKEAMLPGSPTTASAPAASE
jgi:hypothetical protein